MRSIDDYAGELRSAGFVDITPTDLTGDWAEVLLTLTPRQVSC
jgi:hypothetical protein